MGNTTVTETQIAEWKAKHGEILELEIEGQVAYCRKPNRIIWSRAEKATQTSSYDGNIALVTDCWLGGDEGLKTEMKYVNGIAEALIEEVKAVKPLLKKL